MNHYVADLGACVSIKHYGGHWFLKVHVSYQESYVGTPGREIFTEEK